MHDGYCMVVKVKGRYMACVCVVVFQLHEWECIISFVKKLEFIMTMDAGGSNLSVVLAKSLVNQYG